MKAASGAEKPKTGTLLREIGRLKEENNRLREALRKIAAEPCVDSRISDGEVCAECHSCVARAALASQHANCSFPCDECDPSQPQEDEELANLRGARGVYRGGSR